MAPFEPQIERAIRTLVAEPAFSAFAAPDTGILVWSAGGERIVWASPAARPLREALTDGAEGEAVLPVTDAFRIKALAEGAAPSEGLLLEMLRLDPERGSAPLACACRLISPPLLGTLLVMAITGPVPLAETAITPTEPAPAREPPAAGHPRHGETARLAWHSVADSRIVILSPRAGMPGPHEGAAARHGFGPGRRAVQRPGQPDATASTVPPARPEPEPQALLSDADHLALHEIARTLGGRISAPPQTPPAPGQPGASIPARRTPPGIAGEAGPLRDDPAPAGSAERLRRSELDAHERGERIRELESVLATAADGIVMLDEAGRILSLDGAAKALFGYEEHDVSGEAITVLFAPESHGTVLDCLGGLRSGISGRLEGGREITGKARGGQAIPLFMSASRIASGSARKFCMILRDIAAFKKTEAELTAAKEAAEEATAQKSDLLARISHEIRTPLNAIIGFAEMMIEERMGPVGNDRYKSYLKDMYSSGTHVMSLVNDLLDLAKIEAGHMDLNFTRVNLNDLAAACIGIMQEQAARERIVLHTGFARDLPPVEADERSVRQIVLNLLSNAIKFTDAGGEITVSTATTETGAVAIRVRDTGIGMSAEDITAALEPFRQLAPARQRGGTGLGLPLTKALIEANRGSFEISSARDEGTLAEVVFPPARTVAE